MTSGLRLGGTLALDTQMQAICRSMHTQGMLIDQEERARLQRKYAAKAQDYAAKCRELAGNPGLNLNSPAQVGDQLYASRLSGGFGCEVIEYTDSGAASTADPAIRPLLRDPTLAQDARSFILAYRQYRKADKILGTFLRPAEPVAFGESRCVACLEAVADARGLLDSARRLLPSGASADRGTFLRKAEDALQAAVDRSGALLDGRLWATDLWELGVAGWGAEDDSLGASFLADTDEDGVPRALPASAGGALVRAVYSSEDRVALRQALHGVWPLQPRRTPKGGITVARGALVELWRDPASAGCGARAFLGAVLGFFAACSEARRLALPPADAEEDRCYLRRQTGRIHADWKAHVVVTGRLASSPNLQNIPRAVRSMFVPAPGRKYVYADADQLELRTAAARWSALTGIRSRYLDAFATTKHGSDGKVYHMDPHQLSMHGIFKDTIWDWPGAPPAEWHFYKKWPGGKIADLFDIQRDLTKRVVYLGTYGGEALKAHEVLTSAEDDEGTLIYQDLSVREVAAMLHAWRESVPEFVAGWDEEIAAWERQGYLVDPVTGRRAWFRNIQDAQEDRSQIVNFPIQSAGAGLIARGLCAFTEHYPGGFAGPGTGVVNLCHDAITAEVPEAEAPRARELLQQCMMQRDASLSGVDFPAEAVIKTRWEDARP
mgnify:FL=1